MTFFHHRVWCVALLFGFALPVVPTFGLTIRDDQSDGLYLQLGMDPLYDAAGKVLAAGGASIGSGTLITPEWVLTAGHAIAGDVTFDVGGNTYFGQPGTFTYHPSADLGLFRLTQPVTNVLPAERFRSAMGTAIGRLGTVVAYGQSG